MLDLLRIETVLTVLDPCLTIRSPERGSTQWGHWRPGHVLHGLPLGVESVGHKCWVSLLVLAGPGADVGSELGALPDA